MDKITGCVLNSLEEIIGIDQEELMENLEVNLIQDGLLDSISIPTLIMFLEEGLNTKIDVNRMSIKDFDTISTIIQAIKDQIVR